MHGERLRQPSRSPDAALLGCGLLCWCAGDVTLTIQSLGGRTPPAASIANLFYVGFYPLAYVAVFLFLKSHLRRLASAMWLDGAVAGLGAAAVCAAFAFHSIVHSTGGNTVSAIFNIAYPVGDLLLLALVIAPPPCSRVGARLMAPSRRRLFAQRRRRYVQPVQLLLRSRPVWEASSTPSRGRERS